MLKKKSLAAFAAVFALGLSACSSGGGMDDEATAGSDASEDAAVGESYTIKFGNVISSGDSQNQAYRIFADLVNERSDGRITVEIYPDGQLGGEREMVEAVQAGNLEMTAPSVGVLANFNDSLEVFDFPFIFEDASTAYEVLDSNIGTEMLDGLQESGLVGLGWGENGFRNLAMVSDVVRTPADMEGKKLRTMEVPLHIAYWGSIGASPTPLAFTELFTSLQQGVVDGGESPFELLFSAKLTEPAGLLTETRHIYDPEVILIGKDFLEGLSDEDQEIIQTASDEMIVELRELKAQSNAAAKSDIEAGGGTITELSAEERQAWLDSAVPFYEEYAPEVDTEKLAAVLEAAGASVFLEAIQ